MQNYLSGCKGKEQVASLNHIKVIASSKKQKNSQQEPAITEDTQGLRNEAKDAIQEEMGHYMEEGNQEQDITYKPADED